MNLGHLLGMYVKFRLIYCYPLWVRDGLRWGCCGLWRIYLDLLLILYLLDICVGCCGFVVFSSGFGTFARHLQWLRLFCGLGVCDDLIGGELGRFVADL